MDSVGSTIVHLPLIVQNELIKQKYLQYRKKVNSIFWDSSDENSIFTKTVQDLKEGEVSMPLQWQVYSNRKRESSPKRLVQVQSYCEGFEYGKDNEKMEIP